MKTILKLIYQLLVNSEAKLDTILSQQEETNAMLAQLLQDRARQEDDFARYKETTNERLKSLEGARRG